MAGAETKHTPPPCCRCRQLVEVLPAWAPTRALHALGQAWEGDVTCVLPDTLRTLRGALLPPSQDDLAHAVRLVSKGGRIQWKGCGASFAPGSTCWPSVRATNLKCF